MFLFSQVASPKVYTIHGVPLSVTGIAQVSREKKWCNHLGMRVLHIFLAWKENIVSQKKLQKRSRSDRYSTLIVATVASGKKPLNTSVAWQCVFPLPLLLLFLLLI